MSKTHTYLSGGVKARASDMKVGDWIDESDIAGYDTEEGEYVGNFDRNILGSLEEKYPNATLLFRIETIQGQDKPLRKLRLVGFHQDEREEEKEAAFLKEHLSAILEQPRVQMESVDAFVEEQSGDEKPSLLSKIDRVFEVGDHFDKLSPDKCFRAHYFPNPSLARNPESLVSFEDIERWFAEYKENRGIWFILSSAIHDDLIECYNSDWRTLDLGGVIPKDMLEQDKEKRIPEILETYWNFCVASTKVHQWIEKESKEGKEQP